ncbi:hypothetical protein CCACVL1_20971 [Corchorus capsularis]|uniref:Uncharacterized protein n=1 Tax=Corchorus capsularis TaxID=210143 RepID=A0A1R3H915_COCAP|nr:hypothetical protein CCACVL1_20971 [Corchorus capsularis]
MVKILIDRGALADLDQLQPDNVASALADLDQLQPDNVARCNA